MSRNKDNSLGGCGDSLAREIIFVPRKMGNDAQRPGGFAQRRSLKPVGFKGEGVEQNRLICEVRDSD